MTGSTNFTDTGTSTNLNHLVVVRDKEVAKHYSREFKEINQGHFGKLPRGMTRRPRMSWFRMFRCVCCLPRITIRKWRS